MKQETSTNLYKLYKKQLQMTIYFHCCYRWDFNVLYIADGVCSHTIIIIIIIIIEDTPVKVQRAEKKKRWATQWRVK